LTKANSHYLTII